MKSILANILNDASPDGYWLYIRKNANSWSRELGVHPSTITRWLELMEKEGIVQIRIKGRGMIQYKQVRLIHEDKL